MSNDWRDELRSGLQSLLDQAVVSGARQADVVKATKSKAGRQAVTQVGLGKHIFDLRALHCVLIRVLLLQLC
ncbi:hypothetical protein RvVAT039_pl08130 (plasmid) [Agrobacterium vitis]|nr:hypothetical protein RvVAT039_pl08130 [Agrobacterium vitis]